MSASPELMHFLALTVEEQAAAIRALAAQGWSDYGIAGAARLSVEQVRRIRCDGGYWLRADVLAATAAHQDTASHASRNMEIPS